MYQGPSVRVVSMGCYVVVLTCGRQWCPHGCLGCHCLMCSGVCVCGPCGGLCSAFFFFPYVSFMRVLMCVGLRRGVNRLVSLY